MKDFNERKTISKSKNAHNIIKLSYISNKNYII